MRKIIVTRDPAKINLAVLKLVEQLGDLTSLSALASDAEYARSQAVAAAAAAQADQTAAAAAKAGAEAAQASAASSSGTAGAHASAASASATTALLARDDAAISKAGSEAAQAASEGARDASIIAKDQSQAAKVASEAARDVVQSSIYIGAIAPTVTRSGMVWVDETANDIKIRNAANTAWLLISDMIGALVYDQEQSLTDPQKAQARANIGAGAVATESVVPLSKGGTGATTATGARDSIQAAKAAAGVVIQFEALAGAINSNTSENNAYICGTLKNPAAAWARLSVRASPAAGWSEIGTMNTTTHAAVFGMVPPGWQYKFEGAAVFDVKGIR